MKKLIAVGISLVALLFMACENRKAEEEQARKEIEAQARAEAARKEMDALPKAFQTPDYFKKNQPEKKAEPAPDQKKPSS